MNLKVTAAGGVLVTVILGIVELTDDVTGWNVSKVITHEWVTSVLTVITPLVAFFSGRDFAR